MLLLHIFLENSFEPEKVIMQPFQSTRFDSNGTARV
jgi:hypothetical protein